MTEYVKKKDIRLPRPGTIQHVDKGDFRKPKTKTKKDIAEEKSFVAKQRIKEKEKAPSTKEKKDLDATPKRKFIHPIFKNKGKSIEIQKRKEDIKEHGTATPEKHPAHDPDKGGGIHKGKPPKGAQAAEPKIVPKKKPLSPEQKKKDKAIMKAEEARRKKAKDKAAKKKSDAKAVATREDARKPKKKEATKQAETGTRETSYEARVKALVAKKASLSKKETADGRNEYQVQMHKLKKENKKAWKKMFKGGKLKKN